MSPTTKGVLSLVVLGLITIGVWALFKPKIDARSAEAAKVAAAEKAEAEKAAEEKKNREIFERTSESKIKYKIRIGGDSYFGYWFMDSPVMKAEFARKGGGVAFTDDGGKYAERLEKFAKGEYDCIVLPINSYLFHGAKHKFPGTIVAPVCESKGADAILGWKSRFPQGKVAELNDASLRIPHTPDSPSSFLIDVAISDFDLFNLTTASSWRVEVDGSEEVLKKIRARDGDAFILWEKNVSQALAEFPNELIVIWSTDQFGGYIIDVFVFNRKYLVEHEAEVIQFLESYYATMQVYGNNHDRLLADLKATSGLERNLAEQVLRKIDYHDLYQSAYKMFDLQPQPGTPGIPGIANCITACTNNLIRTKKLTSDPLEGDPWQIISSSVTEKLLTRMPISSGNTGGKQLTFKTLDDAGWKKLDVIGTMKVSDIKFKFGTSELEEGADLVIDEVAASLLNNYGAYRAEIRGHTSGADDEEAQTLSKERAEMVMQRCIAVHSIAPERMRAVGFGSKQPPPKRPGESQRAYSTRKARVEFVLIRDNRL